MHSSPSDRRSPRPSASLALALAFVSTVGLGVAPAAAQDHAERMANIAAEHARQMNDEAYVASMAYGQAQDDDYELEADDDGYYGGDTSGRDAMMREMHYALEANQRALTERARMESDPRYQRWLNGGWDFYQSRRPAGPGEYCAATYLNRDGMITLTGLDDRSDGAMLMFVGENIPKPDRFREVTATLTQTGDAPATVRVYNYQRQPQMPEFGTLVFAAPTMNAALAGMTDQLEFAIAIDGQEVFRMSWKDGLAARDQLRRCVDQRRR